MKLWYFISDGGDGSVSVSHFATEAEAQAAADEEEEACDYILEGSVGYVDVDVILKR